MIKGTNLIDKNIGEPCKWARRAKPSEDRFSLFRKFENTLKIYYSTKIYFLGRVSPVSLASDFATKIRPSENVDTSLRFIYFVPKYDKLGVTILYFVWLPVG